MLVVGRVGRVGNKVFEIVNPSEGGFLSFNFICPVDPSLVRGQLVALIGVVKEDPDVDGINISHGHIIGRGADAKQYSEGKTSNYFDELIE